MLVTCPRTVLLSHSIVSAMSETPTFPKFGKWGLSRQAVFPESHQ